MNGTERIYKSISTPPLNGVAQTTLSVFMSIGLIIHAYMVVVLLKTTIPSLLTKLLLYMQCTIEGLYAVLVIVQTNTNNFTLTSNRIPVNPILCYLFQSGALSMIFRVMLYSNILCQSVDRFLALVYPNAYRVYTKHYIIVFITVIPAYSFMASIPRFAKAVLVEGSCYSRTLRINPYLLTAIESLLRFGIPTCILIPTDLIVTRKLYQLQLFKFGRPRTRPSLQGSCRFETRGAKNLHDSLALLQKSLFINTLCITMQMTFTECIFLILTILNLCGFLRYDAGALARVYFLCSVILLDSLNPILSILTIKALRNTARNHCKFVYEFHRKLASEFRTRIK